MNLLITGKYDPTYNRTIVVFEGLRKAGVNLIEFRYDKRKNLDNGKFLEACSNCEAIYLPSFSHSEVRFIKKISTIPVIFDPLISKYLTKAYDYKTIYPYSIRGLKNFMKDKIALTKADIILADTKAHKDYFARKFNIPLAKIDVLPVGYPSDMFYPIQNNNKEKTIVGFYGSFAPLQGIDNIIDAAHLLKDRKDISFQIIGSGFDFKKVLQKITTLQLSNVTLKGWVPYETLNEAINSFDLCLGIFGTSLKTDLVIPNKVYHYMACQKPVITKETPAIKEIFEDQKNIILCENKPSSISDAIIKMLNKPSLTQAIASNGHQLKTQHYNEEAIGKKLVEIIQRGLK